MKEPEYEKQLKEMKNFINSNLDNEYLESHMDQTIDPMRPSDISIQKSSQYNYNLSQPRADQYYRPDVESEYAKKRNFSSTQVNQGLSVRY